ncbi:MAG: AbrB family transcriptional regulator [Rhodospirillales bacterium]|nr:MAG: AbrB family transcriptional regulator [Rhodospirillales bacterium]
MSDAGVDKVAAERARRRRGFVGHTGWRPFALAMALGAAGGYAFHLMRMPLAWMMGAALVGTVAAMSGARIGVPNRLRQVMMVVLGVLLGSGFRPEMVEQIPRWSATMGVLLLVSLSSALVVYWLFRVRGGYDGRTAYFAAMPGGLNEMVTLGAVYGGNERTIALMHAVRILVVVMTIPFWYRWMYGTTSSVFDAAKAVAPLTPVDVAILVACGVVGAFVALRVRMPAAMMFGPMLVSGAVHLLGWTASKPPGELVALAQVVIGAAIGCRFVGAILREVMRDIAYGVAAAYVLILIAVGFAWLGHVISGLPTDDIVLSYAPGGFAEMSLVGLALGADIAMVATHHLFRIFAIVGFGGYFFRRFLEPRLGPAPTED